VLAQLAPAFEIGLQQVKRRFHHSELEPQPVVDGVEGRRQVEADQDSDLLVVGRPVNYPSSVPGRSGRHHGILLYASITRRAGLLSRLRERWTKTRRLREPEPRSMSRYEKSQPHETFYWSGNCYLRLAFTRDTDGRRADLHEIAFNGLAGGLPGSLGGAVSAGGPAATWPQRRTDLVIDLTTRDSLAPSARPRSTCWNPESDDLVLLSVASIPRGSLSPDSHRVSVVRGPQWHFSVGEGSAPKAELAGASLQHFWTISGGHFASEAVQKSKGFRASDSDFADHCASL